MSSGCAVEFIPDVTEQATTNSCEEDSDCGGGFCRNTMCQTDASEIPALLLEVSVPTGTAKADGAPDLSGLSFTSVISEFDLGPRGYEINLGHVARVSGSVSATTLGTETCLSPPESETGGVPSSASDGSIPTRITLTPRSRLLGLSSPTVTSQIDELSAEGDVGETTYRVNLTVPPGNYDVYAEPLYPALGCVRPPFLVLDQEIQPGNVNLELALPTPQRLSVTVRLLRATDHLKGWSLDIVQKDSGRVLSNRAILGDPEEPEGKEYKADLVFASVVGDVGGAASELVRLSPPADVVAPTVYVERSVVDLFQDGTGLIDQLTEIPDAVEYKSRVTASGSSSSVRSSVTLVALKLDSSPAGSVAAFSRTVETGEDGTFETQLLPGLYRVFAEPLDPSYARQVGEVTVSGAGETQTGRNIEVSPRYRLAGRVLAFDGTGVSGAPLRASAVPVDENVNVLEAAQGANSLAPIAYSSGTDSDGLFEIVADAGTFHISARPEPATGFAWAVRLGTEVTSSANFGVVELPLPVVVKGSLLSEDLGTVVPYALIRAYALLKEGATATSAQSADSVVAVGESRVNEKGEFTLLLPSALK